MQVSCDHFAFSCCVLNASAAQSENPAESLPPGKLIQREIANGEAHSYALDLAASQYAYVVVHQKGVDVVVTAFGPDGKQITEMDGPTHNHGPEPVFLLADSAGAYRVEVKSETRRTGTYEIKLEQLRVATAEDRSRVAAQKLLLKPGSFAIRERNSRTSKPSRNIFQPSRFGITSMTSSWKVARCSSLERFTEIQVNTRRHSIPIHRRALFLKRSEVLRLKPMS